MRLRDSFFFFFPASSSSSLPPSLYNQVLLLFFFYECYFLSSAEFAIRCVLVSTTNDSLALPFFLTAFCFLGCFFVGCFCRISWEGVLGGTIPVWNTTMVVAEVRRDWDAFVEELGGREGVDLARLG